MMNEPDFETIKSALGGDIGLLGQMGEERDPMFVHDLVCDVLRVHDDIGELCTVPQVTFHNMFRGFFMVDDTVGILIQGDCASVKKACMKKSSNMYNLCLGSVCDADVQKMNGSYSTVFATLTKADQDKTAITIPNVKNMFDGNELASGASIIDAKLATCIALNQHGSRQHGHALAMYPFTGRNKPFKRSTKDMRCVVLVTDEQSTFTKAILKDVPCVFCKETMLTFYKPQWMVELATPFAKEMLVGLQSAAKDDMFGGWLRETTAELKTLKDDVHVGIHAEVAAKLDFLIKNLSLQEYLAVNLPCMFSQTMTRTDLSDFHQANIMFLFDLAKCIGNDSEALLKALGVDPRGDLKDVIEQLDGVDMMLNALGVMDGEYYTNHEAYIPEYVNAKLVLTPVLLQSPPSPFLDGEALIIMAAEVCDMFDFVRDSNYVPHVCALLKCLQSIAARHHATLKILKTQNAKYLEEPDVAYMTRVFKANAFVERALDEIAVQFEFDDVIMCRPDGVAHFTRELCMRIPPKLELDAQLQTGGGEKRMQAVLIGYANKNVDTIWQTVAMSLVFALANGILARSTDTTSERERVAKAVALNTLLIATFLLAFSCAVPWQFVVGCGLAMIVAVLVKKPSIQSDISDHGTETRLHHQTMWGARMGS